MLTLTYLAGNIAYKYFKNQDLKLEDILKTNPFYVKSASALNIYPFYQRTKLFIYI